MMRIRRIRLPRTVSRKRHREGKFICIAAVALQSARSSSFRALASDGRPPPTERSMRPCRRGDDHLWRAISTAANTAYSQPTCGSLKLFTRSVGSTKSKLPDLQLPIAGRNPRALPEKNADTTVRMFDHVTCEHALLGEPKAAYGIRGQEPRPG